MLSGDNSILQKATDVKTKSDEAQIRERVRLAYNSALTRDLTNGNSELQKPTLDDEINKEFGTSGKVKESGDEWIIFVDEIEIERLPAAKEKKSAIFKQGFIRQFNVGAIKTILESESKPDITDITNVVNMATDDSEPIYMWFESGTGILYWWSEDKTPSLPETTNGLFGGAGEIDLRGMSNWDASTVKSMAMMFSGSRITDFSPISDWDVSNVTSLDAFLAGGHVKDLTPFKNWDVSNVTGFEGTFALSEKPENISAISNWNIEKGKSFRQMFTYRWRDHKRTSKFF